ncbi:MAG: methylmalonyl-CoA mutase family protein, partial [Myxococcota bacterium]|nr:methylmalonyl-CoA mutase family protein [Myxococcota bacterium]
IEELHAYGVDRLYSPDDGRSMGLQGMIDDLVGRCDFARRTLPVDPSLYERALEKDAQAIAALITICETLPEARAEVVETVKARQGGRVIPVLGITGTGGAGKSSLVDELVRRFVNDAGGASGQPDRHVAILSIDPSKRRTGGALLGDRIRMNSVDHPRVYMRSLATRQANLAMSAHVADAIEICKAAGFDLVIVETSGIGQSDTEIVDHCDASLYVMTSEYGAATQLEKIDMLDYADVIAINKFDKRGSEDALRDVRKQFRRNRQLWDATDLPIEGTIASQFADAGVTRLYLRLMDALVDKTGADLRSGLGRPTEPPGKAAILPPERSRYLAEIADSIDRYARDTAAQADIARALDALAGSVGVLRAQAGLAPLAPEVPAGPLPAVEGDDATTAVLVEQYAALRETLHHEARALLASWPALVDRYSRDTYSYTVRGRTIEQPLTTTSLSGTRLPRVALPRYTGWGDVLAWMMSENVPGAFPYAAGVFPLKRQGEDPARMFAGEGGAERTNKRFHYVSKGLPAKRLSTAFDSVTLYGQDPDPRPDIYGKVGNSGVSVATVDDAKKLYSGFDLCDKATSVSMTINGPAPMVLGFFLNAAVDLQCEKYIRQTGLVESVEAMIAAKYAALGQARPTYVGELPEGNDGLGLMLLGMSGDEVLPADVYADIKARTLKAVRGTVQADILKEDQAQNTCIFSTEFALRMMGDIQQYFIDTGVRNFYSVSISGYHIAEAGANPISQLAFTLANGFTFVEYYRARGMDVDDFAPNLSFFFSNGMDPEYAVIGRVARRIWAKAMKHLYGAGPRSQKLKYHIQTSGRSLHAQEIAFNDIRTTLQALYALNDNCNSLHTNAYDEAITTPTEESVRRALAIQLVINKELGLSKNENPVQGSFAIEQLTDLVEQAVLQEFRRISDRGGVLGAMERMYQRSRIQEESLHYETLKHTGELPIIGVNTFLDAKGSPTIIPAEVIRSTTGEKDAAIKARRAFQARNAERSGPALEAVQAAALSGGNIFEALMEATKVCTLTDISTALYAVGGQYRRNM